MQLFEHIALDAYEESVAPLPIVIAGQEIAQTKKNTQQKTNLEGQASGNK